MSIVARILALIAATLLLVAGVEVYNGIELRASRDAEVKSEAMRLAQIAALDMDRILEGSHQLLATLAKLPAANGWDERACSMIAATVNSDFEYDYISVTNVEGRVLCSSSASIERGSMNPGQEIIDLVLTSGEFSIGSYGRAKVSHNEIIRVGYPLTDDDGRIVGVINAGLNATWLNTAINQWQLPQNVLVAIGDRNGILVARNPGATFVGHQMTDRVRSLLRARAGGTIEARGLDGIVRQIGYVPPGISPARGLMVVAGIERAQMLAQIDRAIWTNAAGILTVLLLAGLAAWLYVRCFVDRPFRGLLATAAVWQSGDWTARVNARTGVTEFDRLAGAFDALAEAVEARERSLRENAERLRRSEQHLARAQRVAGVGSFEFWFGSNRREWSAETYRILGLNPADGVPSVPALAQMFIGEGRERFLKRLEIARQSQAASSQEFDIRRPDGIVRTVQIETEVVHGPLGEPLKLIGIYRDVTEMRALERQRDAFEIQLRQSQKLEALGTLAGGIAHDLNNALVPVVGLVQSVMKRVPPDSPERERLALIEAGSQRARDLVRRIVTFARKDEPNRKPIDIGAVVSNALKLLRASTPSTITIEERLSMMPPVHADEGQIVQVVTNLVTNSAQAIGEDMGTIAVEVSEVARSALASHAPAVRLTVADTGCGMDEATRQRVFDPFFTTKEVGAGTGLGLSVVHGIVTAHGGVISLTSEVGRGTRVQIDLPVAAVAEIEGEAA